MKNMKKVVAMIMTGLVIFAFAGCAKKTESRSKRSSSKKTQESERSDFSESKIASTMICVKEAESFTKTMTVYFDEDDLIIYGQTVTVYAEKSYAENNYKYLEESVQMGGILDVELDGNTITETFDINSSSLSAVSYSISSRNKSNLKRYVENLGFECKEV